MLSRFSKATMTFGVFPLVLPLAITAFGGPEGYYSLAIIAFGAIEFIVPKYKYRLGRMDKRSPQITRLAFIRAAFVPR